MQGSSCGTSLPYVMRIASVGSVTIHAVSSQRLQLKGNRTGRGFPTMRMLRIVVHWKYSSSIKW